jgi:hypothetical protein
MAYSILESGGVGCVFCAKARIEPSPILQSSGVSRFFEPISQNTNYSGILSMTVFPG